MATKEPAFVKCTGCVIIMLILFLYSIRHLQADDEAPYSDEHDSVTGEMSLAGGPFNSTAESLEQYRCPEWFRDAKFGIWAHWGPQSVPRQGDWYARKMYIEGEHDYKHHLETYGHPSEHGYKDIIPLWKAEKWDPEALMALYAKAGAKYFVSMGVHHDNFDLWDSKHHEWNAVKMGPKRNVVAEWKKAALKQGMRFGVSEHLGASYAWFTPSHSSDKKGPLAGVPYDAQIRNFKSYTILNTMNPIRTTGALGMHRIQSGSGNGLSASKI